MALASSSSATVAVEKATSDLLIGPDWTMNIDICDSVNSNHWLAKDVVKAVKKRLQHKNPKVQLLALTLLETMVKNCGDYIHFQIAEKNILGEMVRIVKKKTDMHVRDKILVLLDSWQEAFGGPGGKHPQYYWAYEELRRSGVEFPQRSLDTAPIFTPPVAHSTLRHAQAGYGMPSNSSRRLDETMAAEIEGLSLASLESTRNVMELLSDMLQAVNPDDRKAVNDELIVDLVNQCRSNQKKLMQMLTTTGDEELLGQGLELNDSLQILLAKHDAIVSGSPWPIENTNLEPKPSSDTKRTEVKDSSSSSSTNTPMPVVNATRSYIDEEDEEEDDFARLARRHSKTPSSPPQSAYGNSQALVPVDASNSTSSTVTSSISAPCNALALSDPAAPVRTTKEQDIIDLLSITLSTSTISPQSHSSHAQPTSHQNLPPVPASGAGGYPYISQTYPDNQGQAAYTSYVAPWAQPQPQSQHHSQIPSHVHVQSQLQQQAQHLPHQQFQHQPHPQSHILTHPQPPQQLQTQSQPQSHSQPQNQEQFQTQSQPQSYAQPQSQQQFQSQSHLQSHVQPQQQLSPQSLARTQPQSQQQYQPELQPQLGTQPQQQFAQPQPQSQPSQQFPQLHPQPQQQFSPLQAQPQQQFSSPQPQSRQRFAESQPQQQFSPPQPESQQRFPESQPQQQFQPQSQHQFRPHLQSQYPQYSSAYPPPPWAATPGFAKGQSHMSTANNMYSTTQANRTSSYAPAQAARPMNHQNSFPLRGSNGLANSGDPQVSSGPSGQKTFVPSYRLFEDLNVFGNTDGRFKIAGSTSPSLSGPSSQGMVGGRK